MNPAERTYQPGDRVTYGRRVAVPGVVVSPTHADELLGVCCNGAFVKVVPDEGRPFYTLAKFLAPEAPKAKRRREPRS